MLRTLAVDNYRSLRDVTVALGRLTVITGANGVGKSNLYRCLRLLADCAGEGVIAAIAREGGMHSALWAGGRGRGAVGLRLGFADDLLSYAVDLGLPSPKSTPFPLDPEIKRECIWSGERLTPASTLVERDRSLVRVRGDNGGWQELSRSLRSHDSVLSELVDPRNAPEVVGLRHQIQAWRFYDQMRSDAAAPARRLAIATTTPVLPASGAGLAAVIATLRWMDAEALDEAVDAAFAGSRLEVAERDGWLELMLRQQSLLRPLTARELSDGTLRYLLWVAALLTPRPPQLLVLNEPETSLHPELIRPLAALIARAAASAQVVVVTHSSLLVDALADLEATSVVELAREGDETRILGQGILERPVWAWPKR